jgi:SAM-dependent methyltransferase
LKLTLYSKPGCHLCDEAKAQVERLRARGYDLSLEERDITAAPELFEHYRYVIPVVELPNGRRLQAPISEYKLEQLIRSAAELSETGGMPAANREERTGEIQSFFAVRAAGWEDRFPDDDAKFEQAIRELGPPAGGRVLDVGCGTGRALPLLRQAIGVGGVVVGLDVTPEMLAEAKRRGRDRLASLVLADGERLPLRARAFDAVLAAGYVSHLADPVAGLRELAGVTTSGGRLAIFHPIGRAALAARHGGAPSDDDLVAPGRLGRLLADAGWRLESIDDGAERYLALARRV